jgi:hypothetical protein
MKQPVGVISLEASLEQKVNAAFGIGGRVSPQPTRVDAPRPQGPGRLLFVRRVALILKLIQTCQERPDMRRALTYDQFAMRSRVKT